MNRRYPESDVKILWGLAAARCAYPGCRTLCVAAATDNDGPATLGVIAHICAHSDRGPRANPNLTLEQRDCYHNWVLLCDDHARRVDVQPNTFTVADLRGWKADHERWVQGRLVEEMPEITFAELEIVTQAILSAPAPPSGQFAVTDPREKMRRNGLTEQVHFLLTMGLGKAKEVEQFVEDVAMLDAAFPERLKAGFVSEYRRLRNDGFYGDALFEGLREFACSGSRNFRKQAAGLAVLAYLFGKCEVFEL